MKLNNILSDRGYNTWPSWQIVYQWENEISESLNIPIKNAPKPNFIRNSLIKFDNKVFTGGVGDMFATLKAKEIALYFEMSPKYHRDFSNRKNVTPVIIDFWEKNTVDQIRNNYKQCPFLLITSLEVLNFFRFKGVHDNLIHFPMYLPTTDIDYLQAKSEKKYDVILAGRGNPILNEYLSSFIKKHHNLKILMPTIINNEMHYKDGLGNIIGKFHTRKSYLDLISLSKVALYSTPGIDGGEKRTGGFNPVTPRFFEFIAAGCHIIARYPKNAETEFHELDHVCKKTDTYQDFEEQLLISLTEDAPARKYNEYLKEKSMANNIEKLNGSFL